MTYRRKGHAEHDNQSYVPAGEIGKWEKQNDPIDRYVRVLLEDLQVEKQDLDAIDARVTAEIDAATDLAEQSPPAEPTDALVGVYAQPPVAEPLWYRAGVRSAVEKNERAAGWGTFNG
jgi:TPP-dependent pyruvate/acetoin dehydrogenase alpha subunit